eukprot:TRINITY_DN28287_c0_g1_i1.p1 TRINITY_DN28287_c0_g1~~TRINITY_DN28287_c0_g1_i1.p1  ORF type:complete len:367 (-),score=36.16 TRINITY_DN28287_c0_g1_i1:130-1230(-)
MSTRNHSNLYFCSCFVCFIFCAMSQGTALSRMPDPMGSEVIAQRHENRQVLVKRIGALRSRMRQLEQEMAELEGTIERLPYESQPEEPLLPQRFAFTSNALAGGVALPLAIGCMHPLDTVRTQMQAAIQSEANFAEALRTLGWRSFFRGMGTSIIWAAPQGAIRLGSYESCKAVLSDGPLGTGIASVSVSAVVGDLASSFVKVPRELITQKMQTGQYSSGVSAVQSILRREGPSGLLRGYMSTCLRDTPFMVLLFFSYEQFKTWKIRLTFADRGPAQVLSPWSGAETILWGGVSGAIAGLLTTPFDVAKTRIMTASNRLSLADAFRTVGPHGLFTGAGPRSAWWFCVCSIFFGTFERMRVAVEVKS